MSIKKRLISLIIVIIAFLGTFNIGIVANAAKDDDIDKLIHDGGEATGVGLATWMIQCYIDGWDYQTGRQGWGKADCSGTIKYYREVGGQVNDMMASSKSAGLPTGGDASSGKYLKTSDLPKVHGIILHHPGHVGVYLGSQVTITKLSKGDGGKYGMGDEIGIQKIGNALDNSNSGVGMVCRNLDNAEGRWTDWGFAVGCKYPEKGFVKFNNKVFYYKPTDKGYSEYIVNDTVKVDNITYKFNDKGECTSDTSKIKFEQTAYATPKASGSTSDSSSTDTSGANSNNDSSESDSTGNSTDDSKYQASRLEVSSYELDFEQEKRVDEINKDRDRREDEARWQWVYIILSLSGILILVYTLLLVIVYYIDLFNSVTEVSLLHKLTFGHMYPVGSKDNLEHLRIENTKDGPTYATHVTIWKTFVFGVLASAFLMNMRTVVILFLNLTTWFSNLISSMGGG